LKIGSVFEEFMVDNWRNVHLLKSQWQTAVPLCHVVLNRLQICYKFNNIKLLRWL